MYCPVYPGDNDTNTMYILPKILRHQSPGDATHYPVPFPENAANTSTTKMTVVLLITTWHTNYLIAELHRAKGDSSVMVVGTMPNDNDQLQETHIVARMKNLMNRRSS